MDSLPVPRTRLLRTGCQEGVGAQAGADWSYIMSFGQAGHGSRPIHPQFKLFKGDDNEQSGAPAPGELSPQMTLSEFFETWFLPIVLRGRGESAGTETIYRDALKWWVQLTGDPPLCQIDEYTVSTFADGLRGAQYRRGKLGQWRKLGADSIAKHLRQLRALLHRIGPNRDPKRPSKSLVEATPLVNVPRVSGEVKRTLSMIEASQVINAANHFAHPDFPGVRPHQWWRAFLGTGLYVTGMRRGTILKLEWPMLEQDEFGVWWIKAPQRIVPKTHKGKHVALPNWAAKAILDLPRLGMLIFPYPRCVDTLLDDHYDLQTLAGIPADKQFDFKAWRRFHGLQMGRLGLGMAHELARQSLDHADVKTTTGHYVDFENEVRRQLPCPWDRGQGVQQSLFG